MRVAMLLCVLAACSPRVPTAPGLACAPAGEPCVFVRSEPRAADAGLEDPIVTHLWLRAGGRDRILTRSREPSGGVGFLAPRDPRFAPDGRLYVTTDGWSTSPAVQAIDLRTGEPSVVIDGELVGFEGGRLVVVRYLLDLDSPEHLGRKAYRFLVDPDSRRAARLN